MNARAERNQPFFHHLS